MPEFPFQIYLLRLPNTPDDQPGDNRHRNEKADDDKNKRICHTAPPFRIPLHYTVFLWNRLKTGNRGAPDALSPPRSGTGKELS